MLENSLDNHHQIQLQLPMVTEYLTYNAESVRWLVGLDPQAIAGRLNRK